MVTHEELESIDNKLKKKVFIIIIFLAILFVLIMGFYLKETLL